MTVSILTLQYRTLNYVIKYKKKLNLRHLYQQVN